MLHVYLSLWLSYLDAQYMVFIGVLSRITLATACLVISMSWQRWHSCLLRVLPRKACGSRGLPHC